MLLLFLSLCSCVLVGLRSCVLAFLCWCVVVLRCGVGVVALLLIFHVFTLFHSAVCIVRLCGLPFFCLQELNKDLSEAEDGGKDSKNSSGSSGGGGGSKPALPFLRDVRAVRGGNLRLFLCCRPVVLSCF